MERAARTAQSLVAALVPVWVAVWLPGAALSFGAARGQDPVVEVALTSGVTQLGNTVRIEISVENARLVEITSIPTVDGLSLGRLIGPSRFERTQIEGRRVSRRISLEWSIEVRPQRIGEFEIPPLGLRVEGRDVSAPAEAMRLRVLGDVQGADLGFIEILDRPQRVYEGQPFTLDLRFGFDVGFPLHGASLFLPWWQRLRDVIEVQAVRSSGSWTTVRVNDRYDVNVRRLDPERRGDAEFHPFQLRRRYIATRPGILEYELATFEYTERVRRGRSILDADQVRRFHVYQQPFQIEVDPLPEQGRPFEWTGAVGTITAERRVDRRDVEVGNTVELAVSWFGDANFAYFDPPDLKRVDGFEDFRVLGMEDKKFDDERRVVWDLVPATPDVDAIPSVPLWFFDPEREAYRLVETEPVPIRVRAAPDDLLPFDQPREEAYDLRDLHTGPATDDGPRPLGGRTLAFTGLALPLAWLLLRSALRRRRGDPDAPLERRRRRARRTLARDLAAARRASDQAAALGRYLAARTREPDHAWVGRDPRAWAAEHGAGDLDEAALGELVQLSRELDERAWAGGDEPLEREWLVGVAGRLRRGGL